MASVRVGLFPPVDQPGSSKKLQATLARVAEAGVDHLCVGEHVSFFVGAGSDGLVTATSLLASQAELPVYIGLYLLPLRHRFRSPGNSQRSHSLRPAGSRSASGSAGRTVTRSRSAASTRTRVDAG